MRAIFLTASCALASAACRTEQTLVAPDPHLERMLTQERLEPYQADPRLPQGMAMQRPPEGTFPADTETDAPVVTAGVEDGRWAARIPVHVDRDLLETGRARFDVFCAACHGALGDGVSAVALHMALRKPPDLTGAEVRAMPPGRIFRDIREGYGLMPSYSVQLTVRDAWGVVAYVRALQLAEGVPIASLPPALRTRLAQEAP